VTERVSVQRLISRENVVKKLIWLTAATIIGTGMLAGPSMAQPQLQFGIDERGRPQIGIRDPEAERRARWRERRRWEERQARRYGVYGDDGEYRRIERRQNCRLVTIEEQDYRGRTIIRRIRRC
jgi:hypothetical protein